jgi:hypothetical protein
MFLAQYELCRGEFAVIFTQPKGRTLLGTVRITVGSDLSPNF